MLPQELQRIADILHSGGIISYPTEAVYGLGCDPLNETAVRAICALKNRSLDMGLILIASSLKQVEQFVDLPNEEVMQPVLASWPGPHTWLLPAAKDTPKWITGNSDKIAIRITAHPIVSAICNKAKMPIISTSANPTGKVPAINSATAKKYFPTQLDYIVSGEIIGDNKPSTIKDALTGEVIRA